MKIKLGQFEGRKVQAAAVKLSGSTSDRVGHLELGEEVIFIVKGTVSNVNHGDVKDTFTRNHKVSTSAVILVDPKDGLRMLDEAQALADDRFGIENLFTQANDAVGRVDPETGEITGNGA